MRKIYELDTHFATGETTVQPVLLWGSNGRPLREKFTKTASEASEYIQTVEPKPGMSIVLVLALGAYETYDLNRNGDGFNEFPYRNGFKPTCGCCQADGAWVTQSEVLPNHYKSFEEHGKIYRHHQNKDPMKACGDVLKAFWNPQMHRVELLLGLRNELAPDLAQRIGDGEYPAVSMGCSPAGALVLLADGTYKLIEAVVSGDKVITHKGRLGTVTDTLARPHQGEIYTIDVTGFDVPLRLTEEHPLWVVRAEEMVCIPSKDVSNKGRQQRRCSPNSALHLKGCTGCTTSFAPPFEWVRTDAVRAGDYMALPVPTFPSTEVFTPAESRLLGYYLAEGYVWENNNLKTPSRGVTFCTGLHEKETHAEIYALAAELGLTPFEHDVPERNGKYIGVTSPDLADLCSKHCGNGAKTKQLSTALLGSGNETLRQVLGAYANGDGFVSNGSLFFSTSSYVLAHQLQLALAQCEMISTVQRLEHKPNAVVTVATTEYQVRVGKHHAALLGKATRLIPDGPPSVLSEKRFFYTYEGVRYIMARIDSVEAAPYDGQVFNFEVEGDNSYVLDHLAVHNCRIKYDVCTVCGHKAPTRKQYCDHLKFGMRQVTPSGLRAGALNPSPKFFDISFVVKPADLTGYMMRKVADDGAYSIRSSAELGEYLEALDEKRAAIRKIADIDKIVRGVPVDHKTSPLTEQEARGIQQYRDMVLPAVRGMPDFDDGTLKSFAKYPVAQVLSTLSAAGVILTTPEFVKMIVERLAPGTQVPSSVLDSVVAMQGHIFDLFAAHPQLVDQLNSTGMFHTSSKSVNPEIGALAEKYLEKRSTIGDYLSRSLIPPMFRDEEPHWTDQLHISDPSTGTRFETTRGAAREAHDEIAKKELMRIVGTGALLAGGARVAAGALPVGLRPLAYGGAAMFGQKHVTPDYGQQYMTDEGVPISTLTELRKESNDALPLLGSAALVAALGHDYESRLKRGHPVHDPSASLGKRILDRVGEFYSDNPLLGTVGTLGAYGAVRKLATFSESLYTAGVQDSVSAPEIDLDAVVEKIGSLLIR